MLFEWQKVATLKFEADFKARSYLFNTAVLNSDQQKIRIRKHQDLIIISWNKKNPEVSVAEPSFFWLRPQPLRIQIRKNHWIRIHYGSGLEALGGRTVLTTFWGRCCRWAREYRPRPSSPQTWPGQPGCRQQCSRGQTGNKTFYLKSILFIRFF